MIEVLVLSKDFPWNSEVGVKRVLLQENATKRSLGKRHSHEREHYPSTFYVSILNIHALTFGFWEKMCLRFRNLPL